MRSAIVSVMETRPSPAPGSAALDAAPNLAEDLPGLYRTVLDRVATLDLMGSRTEAGRIRLAATDAYSGAWNDAGRNRLLALINRADRVISGRDNSRTWVLRRSLARR